MISAKLQFFTILMRGLSQM